MGKWQVTDIRWSLTLTGHRDGKQVILHIIGKYCYPALITIYNLYSAEKDQNHYSYVLYFLFCWIKKTEGEKEWKPTVRVS